jgi:SprT-like family
VFRALIRRYIRRPDPAQLALDLTADVPRTGAEMLTRLNALGLRGIAHCHLTSNRRVIVSHRGDRLRVHRDLLGAPVTVHRAIVTFICGRRAADRRDARRAILAHPLRTPPAPGRTERMHPDDVALARTLAGWHQRLNAEHFAGALSTPGFRVSRRMRTRLGHYACAGEGDAPPEIVVSRAHIRRDGWDEAAHTLLHEMIHQWQDESGYPVDHGVRFRARARTVGITPAACRELPRRRQSLRQHSAAAAASVAPRTRAR